MAERQAAEPPPARDDEAFLPDESEPGSDMGAGFDEAVDDEDRGRPDDGPGVEDAFRSGQ